MAATPAALAAPGATGLVFVPLLRVGELPPGALRRVTVGDLDVLLAHTTAGIVATDDRCPHMSAPLSLGTLSGCIVDCPLHRGSFDLCSGEPVRLPTTGGLDPHGATHEPWTAAGSAPKPEPSDQKAVARRLTRTRRIRFHGVRIVDGTIEVALPRELAAEQG